MTKEKRERNFRWYEITEGIFPNDGEQIQFDDLKRVTHLGRYYKKDQWDREDVFITTEGAFFMKDQVFAWIQFIKPHLLQEKEQEGGTYEDGYAHSKINWEHARDEQVKLINQLQTQLSQTTKRMEAAEELIKMYPYKDANKEHFEDWKEAYQVWQSLKSQHETVAEDGKEEKEEGDQLEIWLDVIADFRDRNSQQEFIKLMQKTYSVKKK